MTGGGEMVDGLVGGWTKGVKASSKSKTQFRIARMQLLAYNIRIYGT
jgi:hypothetical protein